VPAAPLLLCMFCLQYGERGEQMQENVDSLEEFIGYLEETDSLEEM